MEKPMELGTSWIKKFNAGIKFQRHSADLNLKKFKSPVQSGGEKKKIVF